MPIKIWMDYVNAHITLLSVLLGMLCGVLARMLLLRSDYRQYPTYPHGRLIHISLGVIASALGSVAVPALYQKNYTAITFLTLAAQQFRDVRNMERETLTKIDGMELVPRGPTYIEGIAMVFEGRNYLVIMTALLSCLFSTAFGLLAGIIAGALSLGIVFKLRSGKPLSHIATVESASVRFEGPDLYVGDVGINNVALASNRTIIEGRGIGLIIKPKNRNSRATLSNMGQRQAILYDLSTILGVYRDDGEPALKPQAKLDMNDGRLIVLILPQEKNAAKAVEVAGRVPILEAAVRMPSEASVNRKEGNASG